MNNQEDIHNAGLLIAINFCFLINIHNAFVFVDSESCFISVNIKNVHMKFFSRWPIVSPPKILILLL